MPSDDNTRARLPIGIEVDGVRYRDITIAEMSGVDEENIARKEIRNNGAKAVTFLLRRCVQGVDGLLDEKADPFKLFASKHFDNMLVPDRDYLFLQIQILGGDDKVDIVATCPECGDERDITTHLSELEVFELDDDRPLYIDIDLKKPLVREKVRYKQVRWYYPNGKQQERLASLTQNKVATAMLAACARLVDGEGNEIRIDTEVARRMSMRQRAAIISEVEEMTPGYNLRIKTGCTECEHEWDVDIDVSKVFSLGKPAAQKTTRGGRNKRLTKRKR